VSVLLFSIAFLVIGIQTLEYGITTSALIFGAGRLNAEENWRLF
jgi:hypothetical protein